MLLVQKGEEYNIVISSHWRVTLLAASQKPCALQLLEFNSVMNPVKKVSYLVYLTFVFSVICQCVRYYFLNQVILAALRCQEVHLVCIAC